MAERSGRRNRDFLGTDHISNSFDEGNKRTKKVVVACVFWCDVRLICKSFAKRSESWKVSVRVKLIIEKVFTRFTCVLLSS